MKQRILALLLATGMVVGMLSGCGSSDNKETIKQETSKQETSEKAESSTVSEEAEEEVVDLLFWNVANYTKGIEKDSVTYNHYKDVLGVGIITPYVPQADYTQQLNLKIAAKEMPDLFYVYEGNEVDMINNGALLDLTDLLPEKAPHLWELIPQSAWDAMKALDPTGQGRIYKVPCITDYTLMCGMIRRDWLDALGLEMPKTLDDYVNVLRAFKTQDPNGNGIADELPTGGRAEAKWMDHLFAFYGIAMWEGAPQWDVYDGELTYSAVTPNMKDALAFVADLYKEGLLDPETLLNDGKGWNGKVDSNIVGSFYHWGNAAADRAAIMEANTGVKGVWEIIPIISAPGYEGFYTNMSVRANGLVAKNTDDPKVIDAVMKVLDAYGNQELYDAFNGVEGMHYDMVDGAKVPRIDDGNMEVLSVVPGRDFNLQVNMINSYANGRTEDTAYRIDAAVKNMQEADLYSKAIGGDGIVASIYEGYPDIQARTLYVEYASKIIMGEYDIDKFDEFVEKWYATGGDEVTARAREWYAKTQK